MESQADDGFSKQELAQDNSEPRRLIGNAKVSLWDIDQNELTDREQNRLSTILGKLNALESIIEERELKEITG